MFMTVNVEKESIRLVLCICTCDQILVANLPREFLLPCNLLQMDSSDSRPY